MPEVFQQAIAALKSLCPRPEIEVSEVRPPQRLAPWTFALAAETRGPGDEEATARFVLLHDPDGQESWDGVLRLVLYLRAELDPELASDPLLPDVGWSWLTDALENSGAGWASLGGTVTLTSSDRFGELAGPPRTYDLEMRGSWTATGPDLTAHGEALCELLASAIGLPPVGVSVLSKPGRD